ECPSCHSHKLDTGGLGTERIQSELENLLPEAQCVRLDRDTIRTRADLERSLARFAAGDARVLIGTQMVAKGHDFPGVTLVGVLNADAGLNFPDFRASERTFQLLTQVSGRAGRGEKPGRVLVQTYDPEHYAVAWAAEHNYQSFIKEELAWREELAYPPFTHLALMRFESQSESRALRIASAVAEALREGAGSVIEVLGPAPSPIARLKGLWRFQLLLKSSDRRALHMLLSRAPRFDDPQTRQILDVDPISML
ncbi:MAG: primosomal protein N', partial [Myxococcota bacterium]